MVVLINSCDIEHLFTCLLAIYICFLGEMSFKAFASSRIVLFVFLRLTFMTSLHILDTGSL